MRWYKATIRLDGDKHKQYISASDHFIIILNVTLPKYELPENIPSLVKPVIYSYEYILFMSVHNDQV